MTKNEEDKKEEKQEKQEKQKNQDEQKAKIREASYVNNLIADRLSNPNRPISYRFR